MKTLIKSRYIKITAAILAVIAIGAYLLLSAFDIDPAKIKSKADSKSKPPTHMYSVYEEEHVSGKYTLSGNGSKGYRIEDKKGKLLYETKCLDPWFPKEEGFLVETLEDGRSRVIDLYTGKTKYVTESGEEISKRTKDLTEPGWIIYGNLEDGRKAKPVSDNMWDMVGMKDYYYLRNQDFEVAGDGYLFSDLYPSGTYLCGYRLHDIDYMSREKMNKLEDGEFWGCDIQLVMNTKGEVLYEEHKGRNLSIYEELKAVRVTMENPAGWIYIGLEGENKGKVIKEEWQDD